MLANSSKLSIIEFTFAVALSELTYAFYSFFFFLTFNRIIEVLSLLVANHWCPLANKK